MVNSAKVDTRVLLKPNGSQVYLLGSLVFSGLCVLSSIPLFLYELAAGYVLVAIAAVCTGASMWNWRQSQYVADTGAAPVTSLTLADGTNLQLEGRLLNTPEYFSFLKILTEIIRRAPLPQPDGGWNQTEVQHGSQQAVDAVNEINSQSQSAVNKIVDAFNNSGPPTTPNNPSIED